MKTPRLAARRALRVPTLALLLFLPACYSWDRVELSASPEFGPHDRVRVELTDRRRVNFDRPKVVGDSLFGLPNRFELPAAVALADVRRAHERRFSSDKTVLLSLGVLILGGVAVLFPDALSPQQ